MNINLLPLLVVWLALALAVIVLLFKHRSLAGQGNAQVHVLETAAVAEQQTVLEQKLAVVDKWGKLLTVIAAVYGLVLAALYLYQTWNQMSHTSFGA